MQTGRARPARPEAVWFREHGEAEIPFGYGAAEGNQSPRPRVAVFMGSSPHGRTVAHVRVDLHHRPPRGPLVHPAGGSIYFPPAPPHNGIGRLRGE